MSVFPLSLLASLRFKDCLLIGLCFLFTYLLRIRDSLTFDPDLEIPIDVSRYPNGKFFDTNRALPKPIITDLEGDRRNEIVFIDNDFKIKLFDYGDGERKDDSGGEEKKADDVTSDECYENLRRLIPRVEVQLPQHYAETGSESRPVAMVTGYINRHQSFIEIRRQIIVVAFDTWHVVAYDADLKLLWQVQLLDIPHDVSQDYFMNSITILISATHRHDDEDGMVIVGGAFEHLSHRNPRSNLPHHRDHGSDHHESEGAPIDDVMTHFTSFALNARTGDIRWHHLPGDFEEKKDTNLFAHPVHWKLALKASGLHKKEVAWQELRHIFLRHLPHSWTVREDTVARLENAKKWTEKAKGVGTGPNAASLIAKNFQPHLSQILEYDFGPHSPEDHVTEANSVVLKSDRGIEILDLKSGEPMAILPLFSSSNEVTFADVDDDDNIDQVSIDFAGKQSGGRLRSSVDDDDDDDETNCYLTAKYAFVSEKSSSSSRTVFNVSICHIQLFQKLHFDFFHNGASHHPVTPLPSFLSSSSVRVPLPPPLVVPSVAHRTGLLHHFSGYSIHRGVSGKDVIAALPDGRLTSVGSHGEIHWQSTTASSWLSQESDLNLHFDSHFRPQLLPFATRVFGKIDFVLLAGSHFLSLVDLSDGSLSAEIGLPCPARPSSVIIGDVNGDGVNDVLISCPDGMTGVLLRVQPARGLTALVAVIVVAIVVVLNWVAKEKKKSKDDRDVRRNAKKYLEQFED